MTEESQGNGVTLTKGQIDLVCLLGLRYLWTLQRDLGEPLLPPPDFLLPYISHEQNQTQDLPKQGFRQL